MAGQTDCSLRALRACGVQSVFRGLRPFTKAIVWRAVAVGEGGAALDFRGVLLKLVEPCSVNRIEEQNSLLSLAAKQSEPHELH